MLIMRLFIAIDLPDHTKQELASLINTFKKYNLDAKWVKDTNLHLSLKFLGEVNEGAIANIEKIIIRTAGQHKSLEVTIRNFGFFPNEQFPRVFFVATDEEEALKRIAITLENALSEIGFDKENRFTSHITLARLRSVKNIETLKTEIKKTVVQKKIPVSEIVLFKSILQTTGPVYEKIFSAPLLDSVSK